MSYIKLVNGVPIPMTAQEISARQAEEQLFEKGKAEREWKAKMSSTDSKLPRYVEDIIDALDPPTKAKISQETLNAYEEKKAIRGEKPVKG